MKIYRVSTQKGFSLVELMIVVAITGLIASIGITQYSKMKIKTRATEAKTSLAVLHSAEKSFHGEFGFFHTALPIIGFSLEGRVYFNVGFGSQTLVNPATFNYPTNAAQEAIISTSQICVGYNATGTDPSCRYVVPVPTINPLSTSVAQNFYASAVSIPGTYASHPNPALSPAANMALMAIESMLPEAQAANNGPLEEQVWTIDADRNIVSGYPVIDPNNSNCMVPPAYQLPDGTWVQPTTVCNLIILQQPPQNGQ